MTAFLVTGVTGLLAMAGLVLDGGLALAAKVEAIGIAQEAARSGAQQLDLEAYRADGTLVLEPDEATAAAYAYLDTVGAAGTVTVAGDTVTVTVTATQPTQLLSLAGITSVTVDGKGSAEPQAGISSEGP